MPLTKRALVSTGRRDDQAPVVVDRGAGQAEVQRRRARTFARQQKIAERVAAATAEMASGITESASAALQPSKSMEQIATGAEEASGTAQQSLTLVTDISASIVQAKEKAAFSLNKAEALHPVGARRKADFCGCGLSTPVAAWTRRPWTTRSSRFSPQSRSEKARAWVSRSSMVWSAKWPER